MSKLFVGFIFVLLDFNLNLGESVVLGLIPDFVGYIFLFRGLGELERESRHFQALRPWVIGLGGYSLVIYVLDLLGISAWLDWIGLLLGIAYMIVCLYMVYRIVLGVQDMETTYKCDLNASRMNACWMGVAITQVLSYVAVFMPILALVCLAASLICTILFLAAFHTGRVRYNEIAK